MGRCGIEVELGLLLLTALATCRTSHGQILLVIFSFLGFPSQLVTACKTRVFAPCVT